MEKIKDLIYDKNDILIALVIIAIAALIMFNRIDAIMAYPATVAGNINTGNVQDDVPPQDDNASDDNADAPPEDGSVDNALTGDTTTNSSVSTGAVTSNSFPHSVYIEPGSSAAKIAEPLVSLNLIESADQFVSAVNSQGVASKLKSGTFVIPSNATLEEIVAILTK